MTLQRAQLEPVAESPPGPAMHRGMDGPRYTPRLRLKPKAPGTGYVDGAWWPHSRSLVDELPDLLAVLSVRLGPIERVVYSLANWFRTPDRIVALGRSVRLDGYHYQPMNTVYVVGVNRERLTLLVLAPETDPGYSHRTMMRAAAPNNATTADDLLMAGVRRAASRADRELAESRWDGEGGASAR